MTNYFTGAILFVSAYAILLMPAMAYTQELQATNQDYQNLILDHQSITIEKLERAFGSFDKIVADQVVLANRYREVEQLAKDFSKNDPDRSTLPSVYSFYEKKKNVFLTRVGISSSEISEYLFTTNEMREFFRSNNYSLTQLSDQLIDLFKHHDHYTSVVARNRFLVMLDKYGSTLSDRIGDILKHQYSSINPDGRKPLDSFFHKSLYRISADDSSHANVNVSKKSLEFLSLILSIRLSKTTKEVVALGLENAQKTSKYLLFENGLTIERSRDEEIRRRFADSNYKFYYEKVFTSKARTKCELIFN